jgi:uncharacterized protein (TIGR00251 family)
MEKLPEWMQAQEGAIRLEILVQPRASRTRVVGPHGDRLKIQVAAPPVEGEANDALVRHMAQLFGIPRRDVEVLSGESGRRKAIRLIGVEPQAALERLAP